MTRKQFEYAAEYIANLDMSIWSHAERLAMIAFACQVFGHFNSGFSRHRFTQRIDKLTPQSELTDEELAAS